jgi:hypothetical protein
VPMFTQVTCRRVLNGYDVLGLAPRETFIQLSWPQECNPNKG